MKKHFQGTGIVSPLDGVVQLHEKNSPQSQPLLTQRRMMLDFLSRLGSVILIRNALVWTCHETSKSCQHLSEFRDNQRRPSRLWEDKRVEPFSLKLLKHLKTQHVAGGGFADFRPPPHLKMPTLKLPGWSYGAVNSAIFEYYTKVARNPRSLLEALEDVSLWLSSI